MILRHTPANRRGYTLLEMCAVMGTLGLTLSLGVVILLTAMRANQVGSGTLLQVRLRADVGDTFRTDVASAVASPENLGEFTRSPNCLVLRRPSGEHVIYQWQNNQLTRTVRINDAETRSILSVGIPDVAVAFDVPLGDHPVVTMRVIESLGHGIERRSEFAAALGGDRR